MPAYKCRCDVLLYAADPEWQRQVPFLCLPRHGPGQFPAVDSLLRKGIFLIGHNETFPTGVNSSDAKRGIEAFKGREGLISLESLHHRHKRMATSHSDGVYSRIKRDARDVVKEAGRSSIQRPYPDWRYAQRSQQDLPDPHPIPGSAIAAIVYLVVVLLVGIILYVYPSAETAHNPVF